MLDLVAAVAGDSPQAFLVPTVSVGAGPTRLRHLQPSGPVRQDQLPVFLAQRFQPPVIARCDRVEQQLADRRR